MLGEGPADGRAEKRFSINFSKANTKFSLVCYYQTSVCCVINF